MADNELVEAIKKNWYLVAGCAVLIIGGAIFGMTRGDDTGEDVTAQGGSGFQDLDSDSPTGTSANENFVKRTGAATSQEKKGIQKEKEYLALLENVDELDDDEHALTLFRLANVYYSSLQDYESAILYFQELIDTYPEHERTKQAWRYMADAHLKNEDPAQELSVYREMMRTFPEGSDQYKWAEQQLQ